MAYPIPLTAEDVKRFDEVKLVALLNQLLRIEADGVGVLPGDVGTTLQTKEPDQGVDARTANVPGGSRWIPNGLTVWQSKSGDDHEPATMKKEFNKPGVQEALKNGGSYILWIGADLGDSARKRRRETIDKCCDDAGYPPERCRIYYAGDIAQWASKYPAVVQQFSPAPSLGSLMLWSQWQAQRRYGQKFVADELRIAVIQDYRERLTTSSPEFRFLRIEGLAGVGKSRLALEAFRESPLQDIALYAPQPQDVPAEFWPYCSANNVEAILVVDECPLANHIELSSRAEACNGRVRLLTIGQRLPANSSAGVTTECALLETIGEENMLQVLRGSFPQLPEEWGRFIAGVSSGFVKVAVVLAEALLKANQPQTVMDLIRSREVSPILDALVPDREDRKALEVVSVLRRVGWEDELSEEGKALCKHLGVDWNEARSRLIDIEASRGLISRQGRYRYVTPHILAVWLAASVYERIGVREYMHIHSNILHPSRRVDFEERVSDFGTDPRTAQLSEAIFGPDGPFKNIGDLEKPDAARFLMLLGQARPEEGLRALERLILGTGEQRLRTFVEGRTYVIWTLRAVAWRADLFERAARLMLELAAHEDRALRRVGPHATDEWNGWFLIHLGGTAASMTARLDLLKMVLKDPNPQKRVLAIPALASVFASHESRMSDVEGLGGAPLPPEWHPQTVNEIVEIRSQGLQLLEAALEDAAPKIRQAAVDVLADCARMAVATGLADDLLTLFARIQSDDGASNRKLRSALEHVVEFEAEALTDEQRTRFLALSERIAGDRFPDRLRRYIGRRTPADRVDYRLGFNEEQRIYLEQAEALVDEVLKNPEMIETEWDWLFSPEAELGYYFFWALGRRDAERRWWDFVLDAARSGRTGPAAVSAYLRGQTESGLLVREDVLDEWMRHGESSAPLILDAIWRGDFSDADGERIAQLIERGWLDPAVIGSFYMGSVFLKLSYPVARRLITLAVEAATDASSDAALSLLHMRMERGDNEKDALIDLAWTVLERPGGLWRKQRDSLADHFAEKVGTWLAGVDPARITRPLLRIYDSDDAPVGRDPMLNLLAEAARHDPQSVWELVAEKLYPAEDAQYRNAFRLRLALQNWFVRLIPADILLAWTEGRGTEGARRVAELTHVFGEPMDDLARGLLSRFGTDEDVRTSLYARFVSGSWSGPMSVWLEEKLRLAEIWQMDPDSNVRSWAVETAASLRVQIDQVKLREIERGY